MKLIGLLGGTSWPSTPLYQQHLNEMVNARLGGHHSARILLYHIDYHDIKSRYEAPGGWDEIPDLLLRELETLIALKPDCILICNNTLHKALDILTGRGALPRDIPFIHIVDAVGEQAVRVGQNNLLLLGTGFTMKDGFFARRLQQRFSLAVSTPAAEDMDTIQAMQSAISAGRMEPSFRDRFRDMLARYKGFDGLIPACTELPMAISQAESPFPILDPIKLQCAKAVQYALG